VRRLIVNADDFGLTSGVNRAIVEAHQSGLVTSATLMANGMAFSQAVQIAATVPRLSVGCHLVLVDGCPVSDASQIPSLVQGAVPRFRTSLFDFARHSLQGKITPHEVVAEATAQIGKLQAAGISVSHLDTHKHTHLFPQILRPLLQAATRCGVRAVRNPVEPISLGQVAANPRLWKRWGQVKVLSRMAREFRSAVRDAGMVTPEGTLGIVATGVMDEKLLRAMLANIPDGTWELVCHPGYDDADLARAGTRLRASRVRELELLKSAVIRQELERAGVELISYRDLS